ncbi:MAG TPA: APC family permease [Myxococcaceae bacterium]|nr:APC family permease [Myxococcaceae bacterium]
MASPEPAPHASLPLDKSGSPSPDALREIGLRWANQLPDRPPNWRVDPDIELYEDDEDTGAGGGVIRIARRGEGAALERHEDTLRVRRVEQNSRRGFASLRTLLLGQPIASSRQVHERLSKVKAMAVLSSDPLSSVAYATEQTLAVLLLAGAGAISFSLPVGAAIVVLLLIVGLSYRQTIKAYPSGGGSYIVAKDNLGPVPGLVAAAALTTDYILTVSVSISAGVQAVTSAFPELTGAVVPIGVAIIAIMVMVNLRGVREAGTIFAAPTYLFIIAVVALIGLGGWHLLTQGSHSSFAHTTNYPAAVGLEGISLFLILKAFSSGCTALTGVEAISNGVPIFKPPEWRNARTTLMVMVGLSVGMFAGITILAHAFQIFPDFTCGPGLPGLLGRPECAAQLPAAQTVLSKLGHVAFGTGAGYFFLQATTALILILAANTSFADFPRLLYLLARDKYAPTQFVSLGDRLAFSNGIITLGVLSALLYWYFKGSTDALIPLYTIGVFLAFTLSQAGMVEHWRRLTRSEGASRAHLGSMLMNGTGAAMTTVVLLIAAATKFIYGAWVVVLLVPVMVLLFLAVHRHYTGAKQRVHSETPLTPGEVSPLAVVPVSDLAEPQLQALALARRLADEVVGVFISDSPEKIAEIREKWRTWGGLVPLEVIESPYRSLVRPFLEYLDAVKAQHEDATIMVVLPEMVYGRWWHQFLHNQTALRLKAALLFRPGTVVINVPYHLEETRRAS